MDNFERPDVPGPRQMTIGKQGKCKKHSFGTFKVGCCCVLVVLVMLSLALRFLSTPWLAQKGTLDLISPGKGPRDKIPGNAKHD